MYYYRGRPYRGERGFFFAAPFIGGLLGGLVGSALFYPRPIYPPFVPYGPYGPGPYGPYGGFGPTPYY